MCCNIPKKLCFSLIYEDHVNLCMIIKLSSLQKHYAKQCCTIIQSNQRIQLSLNKQLDIFNTYNDITQILADKLIIVPLVEKLVQDRFVQLTTFKS